MVEILVGIVVARYMSHDAKHRERPQQVSEQVKTNRPHGERHVNGRDYPDQQITRVRYAGESDQTLHVLLGERGNVAKQDGGDGHDRKRLHDQRLVTVEDRNKHQQDGESGRFGTDRQKRGDGGRGPLIHIGNPNLERDRTDLERHPRQHQYNAHRGEEVVGIGVEERPQRIEVHRLLRVLRQRRIARHAVEQNDAEQQNARTQRTHDQIFEPGLEGERIGARIAHQNVEPDRDGFERHEQHHKMIGLRQQHHRTGHHERDHKKLHLGHLLPLQRHDPQHTHTDRRQQEKQPHELACPTVFEQTIKTLLPEKHGVIVDHKSADDAQQAGDRNHRNQLVVLFR